MWNDFIKNKIEWKFNLGNSPTIIAFPSKHRCNWLKRFARVFVPPSIKCKFDWDIKPKSYVDLAFSMINQLNCAFLVTIRDFEDKVAPSSKIAMRVNGWGVIILTCAKNICNHCLIFWILDCKIIIINKVFFNKILLCTCHKNLESI
jgi:hypothetical protein